MPNSRQGKKIHTIFVGAFPRQYSKIKICHSYIHMDTLLNYKIQIVSAKTVMLFTELWIYGIMELFYTDSPNLSIIIEKAKFCITMNAALQNNN